MRYHGPVLPRLRAALAWATTVLSPGMAARAQLPLHEWKLGASPLVSIGGDGSARTEFFRIKSAWRLASGSIVVVDASTNELRVFDARGTFRHSFGRQGAGPGEFQRITWSSHFGDTAVMYDANLRRITTVLLDGAPRLLAELQLRGEEERGFDVVGRLRDGRWLVRALGAPNLRLPFGVQRLTGSIGLLGGNAAAAVQWLSEVPDLSVLVYNPGNGSKQVSVLEAAFASWLGMAAVQSAIWFGDTAGDSLMRFDAITSRRTTLRLPDPPVALTDRVVRTARERETASARTPSARTDIAAKYDTHYLPKTQPVFSDLMPGYGDELWVQRFAEDASTAGRYVVVHGNGVPTARVSVPPGLRVTDVGRDYVVGIHKDLDGIESVRVYVLTR